MEEFTIKELQEDLDYLQYYLKNVIYDVKKIYDHHLKNIQYPKFQDEINANIIASKHMNKNEFELYLSILEKYKERVFDYEVSCWDDENSLICFVNLALWDFLNLYISCKSETTKVEYITKILRVYYVNCYVRFFNFEIKHKFKNNIKII